MKFILPILESGDRLVVIGGTQIVVASVISEGYFTAEQGAPYEVLPESYSEDKKFWESDMIDWFSTAILNADDGSDGKVKNISTERLVEIAHVVLPIYFRGNDIMEVTGNIEATVAAKGLRIAVRRYEKATGTEFAYISFTGGI
jgi:hypothetical protein